MRIGYKGVHPQKECTGINRLVKGVLAEITKDINLEAFYLGTDFLKIEKLNCIPDLYASGDFFNYMKELHSMAYVYDLDIIHSFYYPIEKVKGRGTILTIHDLSPIINPNWFGDDDKVEFFRNDLKKSAKEVDLIIADSVATKLDIQNIYGIEEERVSVVYPGLYRENEKLEANSRINIKKKYGITEDYILSVCTIQPRKNLISLLKAFEIYKEHETADLQLVVCGAPGWQNTDFYQCVNDSRYRNDIIFTSHVPDAELDALYKEALIVAYVSYFEGFGLPILEALDKGKAVISSDTSSMPEVGGDAVFYVNPYCIEEIAEAIRILAENDLIRKQLEKKAMTQASKFSYKKAAKETVEIYKKVRTLYE